MKPANYIAVLAILNAMLERVSSSLPQIKEVSRSLARDEVRIADSGAEGARQSSL